MKLHEFTTLVIVDEKVYKRKTLYSKNKKAAIEFLVYLTLPFRYHGPIFLNKEDKKSLLENTKQVAAGIFECQ